MALGKEGIPFVRFDGSMSMQQRANVLTDFATSREHGVILMSLKAGGQGLNLCFCQVWLPALHFTFPLLAMELKQSYYVGRWHLCRAGNDIYPLFA